MKVPKKLKIGGHVITVDCSQELKGINGSFDYTKNEIQIDKTLPQSQKEVTLIHEVMHAMNAEWNSSSDWHALMDSTSEQLYQVLKDNKLLK